MTESGVTAAERFVASQEKRGRVGRPRMVEGELATKTVHARLGPSLAERLERCRGQYAEIYGLVVPGGGELREADLLRELLERGLEKVEEDAAMRGVEVSLARAKGV